MYVCHSDAISQRPVGLHAHNLQIGIAQARREELEPDNVLNTCSLTTLRGLLSGNDCAA